MGRLVFGPKRNPTPDYLETKSDNFTYNTIWDYLLESDDSISFSVAGGCRPGRIQPRQPHLRLRHVFQLGRADHVLVQACVFSSVHAEGSRHELAVEHHRDLVAGAELLVDRVPVHLDVLLAQGTGCGDHVGFAASLDLRAGPDVEVEKPARSCKVARRNEQ